MICLYLIRPINVAKNAAAPFVAAVAVFFLAVERHVIPMALQRLRREDIPPDPEHTALNM